MTRDQLYAQRRSTTAGMTIQALRIMDDLYAFRCNAKIDPDNIPPLSDEDARYILYIRDRAESILRADREAKEGKRAA